MSPGNSQVAEGTTGSVWARLQYPLVATLLAAFLVVGWYAREPTMRAAGDDELVYLALSKSLETGSYREIYRPAAPLHIQYPPGYPAWLIVVRHTLGENLDVARGVNLGLAALSLFLWFKGARRLGGLGIALPLLLLLAMNRGLLLSGSLTSEGLFLLLSTGALLAMLPSEGAVPRPAIIAVGLAFLAFLTRSIGLALVLPVGVWLWGRRKRGAFLAWAITTLVVVGGWFAYTQMARTDVASRSYASQFAVTSLQSGSRILGLGGRVWKHFLAYATRHIPFTMSLPSIAGTWVDNVAWLLLNAVVITAGLLIFWRKWRAVALYFLLYFGLVLLWPYEDGRLLLPMVPLLLLAFLLGAKWLAGLLPVRLRLPAMTFVVGLAALGALRGAYEGVTRYRECDRANPYSSAGCYDVPRLTLVASAAYLKEHTPVGAVVLTREPASINFLSGHPTEPPAALPPRRSASPLEALRARKIQFVLVTRPFLARRLLDWCASLQFEAGFPPDALVLSVPTGAPAADACPPLREMARLPPPGTR